MAQAGGSPPAESTQNHQNNYGQALHHVRWFTAMRPTPIPTAMEIGANPS
ncbi:MAG: hypothetical protein SH821_15220 [Phototrophicales bacterium]|nr:hypothetical protein [Phototrophicales bacterium]